MIGKKENETSRTLRFVTAASLFDGHDAAINVIRRLIQSKGAEVVHLGHNRSVCEVVRAAISHASNRRFVVRSSGDTCSLWRADG